METIRTHKTLLHPPEHLFCRPKNFNILHYSNKNNKHKQEHQDTQNSSSSTRTDPKISIFCITVIKTTNNNENTKLFFIHQNRPKNFYILHYSNKNNKQQWKQYGHMNPILYLVSSVRPSSIVSALFINSTASAVTGNAR